MEIVNNVIKSIVKKLSEFADRQIEIKVTKKSDRQGHNYWLAFNPTTRAYSYLNSEAEVKMWIEQSYYRS